MLFCVWKFSYSFPRLISNAFRSSPLPEGFSHLGVARCVSTAGCMIRPGRLVILASSRERYDIYFSNPRPWGWKMHVSSLAKAVWVITYASVSSPMSRPYWLGVWQVMHDASLLFPLLIPLLYTLPFPKATLSVCPSIDKHLSTSNLDLTMFSSCPLPSLYSPLGPISLYFWLLRLPLNLLHVWLSFMYPLKKTDSFLSHTPTCAIYYI